MIKHEINFVSKDGKSKMRAIIREPEGAAKGILQIVHGMAEYIDRYEDFMQYLCGQGWICCGHDHLGHGKLAKQEDLGYFADRDGWKLLIEDTHQVTKLMQSRHPEQPYVLMGHSMGSFVARLTAVKYKEDYKGLIICGTGGRNRLDGLGVLLFDTIRFFRGSRHRSRFVDSTMAKFFNRGFAQDRNINWISRDREQVDRYFEDPLCGFGFTASAMGDLVRLTRSANGREWFRSFPKNLPTFIISGTHDPVGDYGKGVTSVYNNLLKNGASRVSMTLYPEGRHEILNEINKEEVYEDVAHFLSKNFG